MLSRCCRIIHLAFGPHLGFLMPRVWALPTMQVSRAMDVDLGMEQCQYALIRLLEQTMHQNLNIGLEANLICIVACYSCLSRNLPLLQSP
jgi:hypothetical protein